MKAFVSISALVALMAVANEAAPQYGGGSNIGGGGRRPAKCRTVKDIAYRETINDVCKTLQRNKCDTKYRQKCTPYQEQVCTPYKRQQCDTKYKPVCTNKVRYEPYQEEICGTNYERLCSKTWQTDASGSKIWVDDKNNCKNLQKETCNWETRQREVPWEDCVDTPYEDCWSVDDQRCAQVNKQRCVDEPWQDCYNEPYEVCEQVHKKEPYEVERQVCEGGAVGGGGSANLGGGGGGYGASDVAEIFDVRKAEKPVDTKQVGVKIAGADESVNETEPDNDAVVFGK